jgi:hypothetical protein
MDTCAWTYTHIWCRVKDVGYLSPDVERVCGQLREFERKSRATQACSSVPGMIFQGP